MTPPIARSLARPLARALLAAVTAAIFVGTLMPGSWKDWGLSPFSGGRVDAAGAAHVLLFACFGFVLRAGFVAAARAIAFGLALGLLTEGLQFFAVDRHPEWRGVLQDVVGTAIGALLARRWLTRAALR